MPNKPVPWLKLWPELVDHEKFAQLSDSEAWTWIKALAKSGQQPTRGRYSSVQHAVVVTGRPKKHFDRLIQVRLMDQRDDGLWMHDWPEWQRWRPEDRTNNDPSPTDDRPNGHHLSIDDHVMINGSTHEDPSRAAERAKREELKREEIESSSVPSERGARLRVVGEPAPKPTPRATPVGTLIDKIRALDPSIEIFGDRGFVGSKLKENPDANLDLIAEAYVSFHHGEWPGSKMLRESGALAWVIGDLGGYVAWRNSRRPSYRGPIDRTGVAN